MVHDDDDGDKGDFDSGGGAKRRFDEFDCPDCSANNPCDPTIGNQDEVICHYCGNQYEVRVNEDGKLKLKEA